MNDVVDNSGKKRIAVCKICRSTCWILTRTFNCTYRAKTRDSDTFVSIYGAWLIYMHANKRFHVLTIQSMRISSYLSQTQTCLFLLNSEFCWIHPGINSNEHDCDSIAIMTTWQALVSRSVITVSHHWDPDRVSAPAPSLSITATKCPQSIFVSTNHQLCRQRHSNRGSRRGCDCMDKRLLCVQIEQSNHKRVCWRASFFHQLEQQH